MKDKVKLIYIHSFRWVLHRILSMKASSKYLRQKMEKNIFDEYLLGARVIVAERLLEGGDHSLESCNTAPSPHWTQWAVYMCTVRVQCTVHVYTTRRPSVATLFTTLSVVPGHWRGNHTSSALKIYHSSKIYTQCQHQVSPTWICQQWYTKQSSSWTSFNLIQNVFTSLPHLHISGAGAACIKNRR